MKKIVFLFLLILIINAKAANNANVVEAPEHTEYFASHPDMFYVMPTSVQKQPVTYMDPFAVPVIPDNVTIGKMTFLIGDPFKPLVTVNKHTVDHIAHGTPVCSGVHESNTADRCRNTGHKLKSGQSLFHCLIGK